MEPRSLYSLLVIGYGDVLTDDQFPTLVPPIYKAKDGTCLLPPFKLDDYLITEATLRSEGEVNELAGRKLVTLLDCSSQAYQSKLLWVDVDGKAQYGPSSEVLSHLREFADEMVALGVSEFGTDNQKALEYAQRAIVADEGCMAALLLKALVYSQEGQEEHYTFLMKMIKTVGRAIINE